MLLLVSWCLLNFCVVQIDYQIYLSQISNFGNHNLSLTGVYKHIDGSKCLSESAIFSIIPVYAGICCLIILRWSVIPQCTLARQASLSEPLEIEEPKEPARAPFDWSHAALEPFRDMLKLAQQQGIFSPQPGLPL